MICVKLSQPQVTLLHKALESYRASAKAAGNAALNQSTEQLQLHVAVAEREAKIRGRALDFARAACEAMGVSDAGEHRRVADRVAAVVLAVHESGEKPR